MNNDEREKLIKEMLEDTKAARSLDEKFNQVMERIDLIMDAMVVQQKDAAALAGVTPATIRNKTKEGKIQPLQKDGSRLNYFTLRDVENLKRRNAKKR